MNSERKIYYYLTPLLFLVLVFLSNFLDTELFNFGGLGFAVWFVLSVFCFSCGWLIDKTFGWKFGGKLTFSLTVASVLLSVVMISFFRDYFSTGQLLAENLILYSLRNVTLGCMGFFGMTLAELLTLQRDAITQTLKIEGYEKVLENAHKEAELEVREAKLKAETMLKDAETRAKQVDEKKERIERELKELIQTERELIRKYEEI